MSVFMKRSQVRDILVLMLAAILAIGNGTVFAEKEKPGKVLILEKKDGQTIRGELLAVKGGTLTMLVFENNQKMNFRFDEIAKLRGLKKNSSGRGLLSGFLTGAGIGLAAWASASGIHSDRGLFLIYFIFTFAFSGAFIGLTIGSVAAAAKKDWFRFEGQKPEKLLQIESTLATLARFRANTYSYWKFVFCGPSDETHVLIFTVTGDPGKFEFHGVDDHNGTFTDDGKVVAMALPGRPDTVCSGRFIDADHMAGTWESSGQTWTWTAVRTSWTAAVKETPICESQLFFNKN